MQSWIPLTILTGQSTYRYTAALLDNSYTIGVSSSSYDLVDACQGVSILKHSASKARHIELSYCVKNQ